MKKEFGRIMLSAGLLVGAALAIYSCGKVREVIPNTENSLFGNANTVGLYFIKNDPKSEFKIPIGISSLATTDRTIQFSLTSPTGAAEGAQYNLGTTSVKIPAGQSSAELTLKGLFAGYPTGRKDTLNFKITGGDIPSMKSSNLYTVVMQKYCDVSLAAFTGTYKAQDYKANGSPDGGPYTLTITPGTVNANGTSGFITITGLWGVPDPVKINLDWKDPANFTTSVPTQPWFVDADYGQSTIRPNGTRTFSSCDNSFTIGFETTVNAGTFGKITSVITK